MQVTEPPIAHAIPRWYACRQYSMRNSTHPKRFIAPSCAIVLLSSATCVAAANPGAGEVQLGIRGTVVQSTTVETDGSNAPPKASTTQFGLLGKGTLAVGYLLSEQVLLGIKLVDAARVEPNVEYWFAPGPVTPYAGLFVGYGNAVSKSAGETALRAGLEFGVHGFVGSGLSLDANVFGALGSASRGPDGARLKSTDTSLGLLVGLSIWPSAHAGTPQEETRNGAEPSSGDVRTQAGRSDTSQSSKPPPQMATVHTTEQNGLFSLSASFPSAERGSLRMILAFRPAEDAEALTMLLSRAAPLATTESNCGSSFVSAGENTEQLSELTAKIERTFQSVQITQRGRVAIAKLGLLSEVAPAIGVCKDTWQVTGQAQEQLKSFFARVNARAAKDATEREASRAKEREMPSGDKAQKSPKKNKP